MERLVSMGDVEDMKSEALTPLRGNGFEGPGMLWGLQIQAQILPILQP